MHDLLYNYVAEKRGENYTCVGGFGPITPPPSPPPHSKVCGDALGHFGNQMKLLTEENGKDDQNFLYREIEAGARTGAHVEWMQDD